jgi:biopolymer transport protein TolR
MAFSTGPAGDDDALHRPLADINVTPLVDVMLVLLIIFMVTAPLLATGMKVTLPNASAARPLDQREPIVVAIARDGALQVDSRDVTPELLVDAIRERIGDDTSRVIQVRGDRDASYGAIVSTLDLLAKAGLTHIAIVADARGRPVEKTMP